jgi:hypothetical protein
MSLFAPCNKLRKILDPAHKECIICAGERFGWKNWDEYMREYTGDRFHQELNEELWQYNGASSARLRCFIRGLAFAIYNEFETDLPDVLQVYRGIELDQSEIDKYRKGRLVYWPGFTSTSKSLRVVEKYFEGNTLFLIKLRRGKRLCVATLKDRSQYQNELEVLISANCGFRVEKRRKIDTSIRRKFNLTSNKFTHFVMMTLADEAYAAAEPYLCADHTQVRRWAAFCLKYSI